MENRFSKKEWDNLYRKGMVPTKNENDMTSSELGVLESILAGTFEDNRYRILTSEPTEYTAIDLFAGAGGTALGLENAGFTHLMVNEFDKHAADSLRHNRPAWHVDTRDVAEVSFEKYLGKVNVIQAGFPCQTFSHAGSRAGFSDTRGTLFHHFIRSVDEARPEIAIGENVKGLVTHDKGRTLNTILESFENIDYTPYWKVMRAQFLGVGQKRERVFIFAIRNDLHTAGIVPTYPAESGPAMTLREVLEGAPLSQGASYSESKRAVLGLVPEGGNWKDLPEDIQKSYLGAAGGTPGGKTSMARRLAWNEPSLTLMCSPAQKQTERCHPEETRPLTVREYARVQSFPDVWEFSGPITAQYKQIGNAVPPNMAYHIGREAVRMLDEFHS